MKSVKLEINNDHVKNKFLFKDAEEELQTLLPHKKINESTVTLKPKPGICIKTKDMKSNEKVFMNVCTSAKIPEPEDISDDELVEILESEEPSNFKIPMSIGEGHEEQDKSGNSCTAYDIIIHPEFLKKISDNPLFLNFFILATSEGLNEKYDLKLNMTDWHLIRNKKYYGTIGKQVVRTEIPLVQELSNIRHWDTKSEYIEPKREPRKFVFENSKKEPKFVVCQMLNTVNNEKFLQIVINLPELNTGSNITLKMSEDSIVMDSSLYFLHIGIPHRLDTDEEYKGYFIKSSKELIVQVQMKTGDSFERRKIQVHQVQKQKRKLIQVM